MSDDEVRQSRNTQAELVIDFDKEFLTYIEKQIAYFLAQDKLGKESNLSFESLYLTLQGYQSTFYSLLAMHEKASNDYSRKKTQYQIWWDEKFILIRQRENKIDLAAQKWASKAELESMTRIENKAEYLKWEEELRYYEGVATFIKRILDQWSTQSYVLGHLKDLFKTDIATTNIRD